MHLSIRKNTKHHSARIANQSCRPSALIVALALLRFVMQLIARTNTNRNEPSAVENSFRNFRWIHTPGWIHSCHPTNSIRHRNSPYNLACWHSPKFQCNLIPFAITYIAHGELLTTTQTYGRECVDDDRKIYHHIRKPNSIFSTPQKYTIAHTHTRNVSQAYQSGDIRSRTKNWNQLKRKQLYNNHKIHPMAPFLTLISFKSHIKSWRHSWRFAVWPNCEVCLDTRTIRRPAGSAESDEHTPLEGTTALANTARLAAPPLNSLHQRKRRSGDPCTNKRTDGRTRVMLILHGNPILDVRTEFARILLG